MPRYEYRCACGAKSVRFFAMREVCAAVRCGTCDGEARRMFTAPQLKTSSLFSEANQRGLAELDATRRVDETAYAQRWNRPLPDL